MATPAPPPTTPGELLFQNYLDAMRYPYEFEKQFPGKKKRPDYTVNRNGEFLFDVKDFEPYMPLGFGGYDPYPRIREKIEEGRKKFKEFKGYPCSLVLKNNGNAFVHLETPDIMLGSMYGNAGFRVPVWLGNGPMPSERPDLDRAFLGGGKMIRPARYQNTTISALISLRHVGVGSRRIDKVWQERKRADESFGKKDLLAAYEEVSAVAAQRYPNFDPAEKQLGVIVWENAVARIPLSRELFTGRPYDERWGCEDGHQLIVFRGEKLAELSETTSEVHTRGK
jgi:hypothetical protein